jgi:hypothetical protein
VVNEHYSMVIVREHRRGGRPVVRHIRRRQRYPITVAMKRSKLRPPRYPNALYTYDEDPEVMAFVDKEQPEVIRLNFVDPTEIELIPALLSHETLHSVLRREGEDTASVMLDEEHGWINENDTSGLRRTH